MLSESLSRVMLRMRLGFLRKMFITVREESRDLTPMEIFCLEGIEAMERPTISQFARFTGISQSNATYRVNHLIQKGYVQKTPSQGDRREAHLHVTNKYMRYWNEGHDAIHRLLQVLQDRFSPEEVATFTRMLQVLADTLPEQRQDANL